MPPAKIANASIGREVETRKFRATLSRAVDHWCVAA
jgi:hypothetical protein